MINLPKRRSFFAQAFALVALVALAGCAGMPDDRVEYFERLSEAAGISVAEYQAAGNSEKKKVVEAWNEMYDYYTDDKYSVTDVNHALEGSDPDDVPGSALQAFAEGHGIEYHWDFGESRDEPAYNALRATINDFTRMSEVFGVQRIRPFMRMAEKKSDFDYNAYSPLELVYRMQAFLAQRDKEIGEFTTDEEYPYDEEGGYFKLFCAATDLDYDAIYPEYIASVILLGAESAILDDGGNLLLEEPDYEAANLGNWREDDVAAWEVVIEEEGYYGITLFYSRPADMPEVWGIVGVQKEGGERIDLRFKASPTGDGWDSYRKTGNLGISLEAGSYRVTVAADYGSDGVYSDYFINLRAIEMMR